MIVALTFAFLAGAATLAMLQLLLGFRPFGPASGSKSYFETIPQHGGHDHPPPAGRHGPLRLIPPRAGAESSAELPHPAQSTHFETKPLPPADWECAAKIWTSPSIGAFLNRRLDQLVRHGHSPEADLDLPLDKLLREARARIDAALDYLGQNCRALPPERADVILAKAEIAGALMMAAYDRLLAAMASRPGEEGP